MARARSLAVSVRNLSDKLGPPHVQGAIDGAGFWPSVVFQDFYHQRCVIRQDYSSLQHPQKTHFVLGFTESAGSIHNDVCLQTLSNGSHRRKRRAYLERNACEDEFFPPSAQDRLCWRVFCRPKS